MRWAHLMGLLAILAVLGCGKTSTKTVTTTAPSPTSSVAAPGTSATGAASGNTTRSASPVVFQGVTGAARERPPTLPLTVDGTLFVLDAKWSSWGGSTASGTGSAEYHSCEPSCAQGKPHRAPVSILLAQVRSCAGRRYYSRVTLTLGSGRQLNSAFLAQRKWSPC